MTTPFPATSPEPAWLTAAADQRVALMADVMVPGALVTKPNVSIIMTTLTEPKGEGKAAYEYWDKSCDNCGKHCPQTLTPGHVKREMHGLEVVITFGACPACKEAS